MRRPFVGEVDARVLPDLVSWWRAETHREKFGDGQPITYTIDESGNGNNMYAPQAPLFNPNGPNGYASIVFDGVNDELRSAMSFTSAVKGCFAVVRNTVGGNWGAGHRGIIGSISGSQVALYGVGGASTIATITAGTLYVNGVQTDIVANVNAWNLLYLECTALGSITTTNLARLNGGTGYLGGEIAEAGIFRGTPTAAARAAFFAQIIQRYAITGNP